MIDTLFQKEVLTAWSEEEPDPGLLFREEAECVRNAVPKRRREFAQGRLCARRLLAELGIRDFPILMREDRSPIWPEGIAGSLSHCEGYCAVALARKSSISGLGLDIETVDPLDENLVPLVCGSSEIAWLGRLPVRDRGLMAKLVFSAKESVFKCVHPVAGVFLDFQDCEMALQQDTGIFFATLVHPGLGPSWRGRQFQGRFARDSRRLFTAIALPAGSLT